MLPETRPQTHRSLLLQLFAWGGVLLFLELALLRYLAANIWNLGYFPQLVYLASLLGIGGGLASYHLLPTGFSKRLLFLGPILLVTLVLWASTYHPSMPGFEAKQGVLDGHWYITSLSPYQHTQLQDIRWLIGFFVWIVAIFFCLSQQMGHLYARLPSLRGYRWQTAGALVGSLLFLGCSTLRLPPYVWFLVLIPLVTWLSFVYVESWQRVIIFVCMVGCAGTTATQDRLVHAIAYQAPKHTTYWSPYQKIDFAQMEEGNEQQFVLFINGLRQQRLALPHHIPRDYGFLYIRRRQEGKPQYKNVLILGAGVGNDVAAALILGAYQIDAVEIDPVIIQIASKHHPARPYNDSRVTVHIEDARTHLAHTKKRYDLILFADPHSIIRHSPLTQLRQENYLFTVEALQKAYERLTPDGEVVIYGAYKLPWLQNKLRAMFRQATSRRPDIVMHSDQQTILRVSKTFPKLPLSSGLGDLATDNWPFLYLKDQRLPKPYKIALLTMLGSFLLLVLILFIAPIKPKTTMEKHTWTTPIIFLGLGLGYILFQAKAIVQLSLWMGATWQNHAFVFSGSLLATWLATWLARYLSPKLLPLLVLLLLGAVYLSLALPTSSILQIAGDKLRLVSALALLLGPLLFASLLFAVLLQRTVEGSYWVGWNFLGSVLGGALESLSLLTGYRFLTWLVLAIYGIVALSLLLQVAQQRDAATAKPNHSSS